MRQPTTLTLPAASGHAHIPFDKGVSRYVRIAAMQRHLKDSLQQSAHLSWPTMCPPGTHRFRLATDSMGLYIVWFECDTKPVTVTIQNTQGATHRGSMQLLYHEIVIVSRLKLNNARVGRRRSAAHRLHAHHVRLRFAIGPPRLLKWLSLVWRASYMISQLASWLLSMHSINTLVLLGSEDSNTTHQSVDTAEKAAARHGQEADMGPPSFDDVLPDAMHTLVQHDMTHRSNDAACLWLQDATIDNAMGDHVQQEGLEYGSLFETTGDLPKTPKQPAQPLKQVIVADPSKTEAIHCTSQAGSPRHNPNPNPRDI